MAVTNDKLARYYTEKLWDWIPAVYRDLDAAAPNQHVLRAIIQAVAEQAAAARRSVDRMWENQAIEFCDDAIVPFLGDLVGTRLVPVLNARGRRVDVARTIHYRRRAGTVTLLEQLILDMSGWDGAVVEAFRRLGRTRHLLDPLPVVTGRYTNTPSGGLADLRYPRGVELAHGTWDEFSHAADLSQHRGHTGRHAIPKLNHHLYRMRAFKVEGATPYEVAENVFTFDPSGRTTPLYMPSYRPEDTCRRRREWDVEGPIRCRLLGHAEYEITEAVLDGLEGVLDPASLTELADWVGVRFRDEGRVRATLSSLVNSADFMDLGNLHALLALALTEDSAKAALVRDARAFKITQFVDPDDVQIPAERTVAGALLGGAPVPPSGKALLVDPTSGLFALLGAPPPTGAKVAYYHYGFAGELGAGTYDRRAHVLTEVDDTYSGGTFVAPGVLTGVYSFLDSATYTVADVSGFNNLTFQAANQQRPYLRRDDEEGTAWVFTSTGDDAELTLDGLWYGGGNLVLAGDYKRVTIRHCTLDPGGVSIGLGTLVPANIVVQGSLLELVIESSIVPQIGVSGDGVILAVQIRDSIVASADGDALINLPETEFTVERTTLDMPLFGLRIRAAELLAAKGIAVIDRQNSCARFSALQPLSSYEVPLYPPNGSMPIPTHSFVSLRFGDPGYYVLSESAPELLIRGAENGSEIGAYCQLMNPLKLDSVRAKVHEYMPLGRIAAFIRET